ncbi:hypothetical protein [Priestia endophytica]|uniref:hypothetical protein n=1 Tax=Priestia endophytica TaxID=135735 RepID=UPI000DCA79C3|nr:hypothetical protein [Priestia endophytica]RAS73156.1 hypothetical protein A4R27_25235 [Priestia endophytica]
MEKSNREARLRRLYNQDISRTSDSHPKPIPDSSEYECKKIKEIQELIPVKKIMGGNPLRINTEKTWLENFEVIPRMDRQLDRLEKEGLSKLIAFLQADQKDEIIVVDYYNNLDEFYVMDNGSHRTTLAKVMGIETIKARVRPYEFKPELLEKKKRREQLEIEKKAEEERLEKEFPLLRKRISNLGLDSTTKKDSRGKSKEIYVTYKGKSIDYFNITCLNDLEKAFDELEVLESLIDARRLLTDSLLLLNIRYFKLRRRSPWYINDILDKLAKSNYFK